MDWIILHSVLYSLAIVQMQCSIIRRRFTCSQTLGKVIELDNVLLEELLQWPARARWIREREREEESAHWGYLHLGRL